MAVVIQSKLEREFITRFRQIGTDLPAYIEQHQFCPNRRYAFDFAWPDYMLAVEINGGNRMVRYSQKLQRYVAVGRHTKSKDYEKLNHASWLGWTILQFTGEMLRQNPQGCINDLRRALAENEGKAAVRKRRKNGIT